MTWGPWDGPLNLLFDYRQTILESLLRMIAVGLARLLEEGQI